MTIFSSHTASWFERTLGSPTAVQAQGWPKIAQGYHSLLVAPTGSGKTLAAFLWSIDQLTCSEHDGTHTLYVSPLKALVYDIERNLRAPIRGIHALTGVREPSVAVRTGDTSAKERTQQLKNPADIVVTTPESLFLLLTSRARDNFRNLKTIIVDEIHAIAGSKRGAHLALSLERLGAACDVAPQRIGLSATVEPKQEIGQFLVGTNRDCHIIDCSATPKVELSVSVPVGDMTDPLAAIAEDKRQDLEDRGMWVVLLPRIVEEIRKHQTTIVFVNSRNLCERLTSRLRDELGDAVRSHHGSLSQQERRDTEEALKKGQIQAIVATSSLELGVDMGAVDLVILPEAPPSTASALQRIGRAGHQVGEASRALVLPKHQGQLLQTAALTERVLAGRIEPIKTVSNPLDVLAQHIVSMVAMEDWHVDDVFELVRAAHSFRHLSRRVFDGVLNMLDGKYPSVEFSELRARLSWKRQTGMIAGSRGAQLLAVSNVGTIPDRGMYPVHLGEDGPRIGELDEEMVHEIIAGQTFLLGTSTWRVENINHDRVVVLPAPGEPGRLPFWRGEGASRPYELGKDIGRLARQLLSSPGPEGKAALQKLGFDAHAAQNTIRYIEQQRDHSGAMPTDRQVVVERFEDELGDQRIAILSPFGRAFHAAWAIWLQATVPSLGEPTSQVVWSDDGIIISAVDSDSWGLQTLIPNAEELEDTISSALLSSPLFATLFRDAAGRSLLLARRRPGKRTPLWLNRLRSQKLLAVAKKYSDFPIVLEAHREALQDVLDVGALRDFLGAVKQHRASVVEVELTTASPMARSLVNTFVGNFMYQGEVPLTEKKLAALTIDQSLLRELLGSDAPRATVEPETAVALERDLQFLSRAVAVTSAADIRYLLARLGDLSVDDIGKRVEGHAQTLIDEAVAERLVTSIQLGEHKRFIAINECGLYRDGIGVAVRAGVAEAYLEPVEGALDQLIQRYARGHGPFGTDEIAQHWRLPRKQVEAALERLVSQHALVYEELLVDSPKQYCAPDIAKRLRKLTIASLRQQVEPVTAAQYTVFLGRWQGVTEAGAAGMSLREAVETLQGLSLPFSDLIGTILPARVPKFSAKDLSDACARGELAWVGTASLGKYDCRVALYLRENLRHVYQPDVDESQLSPEEKSVLEALEKLRASFFVELCSECSELSQTQVSEALWSLVWRGLVTNDTLNPLLERQRRGKRRHKMPTGRWSLLASDQSGAALVKQTHAQVMQLLTTYGVISKHHPAMLSLAVRPAYAVLFEAEMAAKVRSGLFVEDFEGMQFASTGAIDVLRETRASSVSWMTAADDPANPYGSLCPWPSGDRSLRRVAGAQVVFVDGMPIIYLDKSRKRWTIMVSPNRTELLLPALERVKNLAGQNRLRELSAKSINGQAAKSSSYAAALQDCGFAAEYDSLVYRVER